MRRLAVSRLPARARTAMRTARTPAQRNRGVALIVALLVVALATLLVAALLDRGELALARTRNGLRAQQVEAYAQGLEAYASQALLLPRDGPDTANSPWAQPLPPQQVPGGMISASMRDLNGCFNLNNLAPGQSPQWKALFVRLLKAQSIAPAVADAVQAWLDPERAIGADASAYLGARVPYRPHGGLFSHVSELRLVRGIDTAAYARLAPQVCALPPGTKINVNTAGVPLLQALAGTGEVPATVALAQRLWQNGRAQWAQTDAFWQATPLGRVPADLAALVGVNSVAFLLRGDIVLDGLPFTVFRVVLVQGGRVRIVQRSRGADEALVGLALPDAR